MRCRVPPIVLLLLTVVVAPVLADDAPEAWLRPFGDNINHWQNKTDDDRYARYRADQVREIAGNILLHQRENGGWHANWDPARVLTENERAEALAARPQGDTSLDNRTSYTHLTYLAHAFAHTGDETFRDGALRGIEFLLAAQYESGGWPHSYPSRRGYHPRITLMDDVTIGALATVRDVAAARPPFAFVPMELRERCIQAQRCGEALLLKLQVRDPQGRLTVWAGQYDEETLLPCAARAFELPSLVSAESTGVVRYLMEIEQPSAEVRAAIDAAAAWFEGSVIHGLRIERVPIDRVRFPNHTAKFDVIERPDPDAPPLWARFYELDTNRPFMANRDGGKVYRLADVELERRTGYGWYGGYATRLLERDYPQWQTRVQQR